MPDPPFSLPSATRALEDAISERRQQHAARAERFGMPAVVPVTDLSVLGARRAAARPGGGFVTGFDITAPEEDARRAVRATRFAAPAPAAHEGSRLDATHAGGGGGGDQGRAVGHMSQDDAGTRGVRPAVKPIDPLENRRDVAIGEDLRANTIHVFGVDNMSTEDIRRHFLEYGPSWIEWINDSSCNVTFEDDFTAARVLRFMPTAAGTGAGPDGAVSEHEDVPSEPPDRMGDDENAGLSVPVASEGGEPLPDEARWRPATPFVTRQKTAVPLWIRAATERDVRPARPNPKSKWARSVVSGKEQKLRKQEKQIRSRRRGRMRESSESNDESNREPEAQTASEDVDVGADFGRGRSRGGGGGGRGSRNRRLGVRGGITKAMAKRLTVMDVDRALESR
jgi:hypothetical protein